MSEALLMDATLTDPRLVRAVQLIWREAELLDGKEYAAWKDLYAPDAIYVIPVVTDTDDFENNLNLIYDDDRMRELRISRFLNGYSASVLDAARTVRTVSRFVPVEVTDDVVTLRAGQILVAYKEGRFDHWIANVDFKIRLRPEGDQIVRKVVRLVNSADVLPAAGFLL